MASRNGGPGSDHTNPGIDSEGRLPGGETGNRRTTGASAAGASGDHDGTDPRRAEFGGTLAPRANSHPTTRLPEPQLPDTPTGRRTASDPPLRDPGLYALTNHFRERLGQPGRYVSIATASEAIRSGQLRWNATDGWRFATVEDGVRFVVVVGDTETASPVVVTAWTEVDDWRTAMESNRWTPNEVHTIQLRSDLSAATEDQIPERIRPRDVDRPFVIGKHRVHTRPGRGYVACEDCGSQFRSKADLTTRYCH